MTGEGVVALYVASEQGIDVGNDRYAAVCETHATICGFSNKRRAIGWLSYPEFCQACQDSPAWQAQLRYERAEV
jgi:hypothetical protein